MFFFYYSSFAIVVPLHCRPRIAANGMAAWRRGGFHYLCCGRQTFNYPQNFLRDYCPPCAKPLVSRSPIFRERCPLHCIVGLYFVVGTVLNFNTLSAYTPLPVWYSIQPLFDLHSIVGTVLNSIVGLYSITGTVHNLIFNLPMARIENNLTIHAHLRSVASNSRSPALLSTNRNVGVYCISFIVFPFLSVLSVSIDFELTSQRM